MARCLGNWNDAMYEIDKVSVWGFRTGGYSGHFICYSLKRERIYLKFGSIGAFTLHSFLYKFWVFRISESKDTVNYAFTQTKNAHLSL